MMIIILLIIRNTCARAKQWTAVHNRLTTTTTVTAYFYFLLIQIFYYFSFLCTLTSSPSFHIGHGHGCTGRDGFTFSIIIIIIVCVHNTVCITYTKNTYSYRRRCGVTGIFFFFFSKLLSILLCGLHNPNVPISKLRWHVHNLEPITIGKLFELLFNRHKLLGAQILVVGHYYVLRSNYVIFAESQAKRMRRIPRYVIIFGTLSPARVLELLLLLLLYNVHFYQNTSYAIFCPILSYKPGMI